MDGSKVDAVVNWPQPTTLKGLRGFLGLAGYYMRFIQSFGIIARPLNDLLKKGNLKCTEAASQAFDKLKLAVTSAPELALSDFSTEFIVETEASIGGIGAVFAQNHRPIAFLVKGCMRRIKPYQFMKGKC